MKFSKFSKDIIKISIYSFFVALGIMMYILGFRAKKRKIKTVQTIFLT